ncbi:replication initiation protein RepC [Parasphingorhabdus cellanae]|uniref:Replication protein-C C-terminal domain-containing protein n=1 Tax=Parasphingorhabdus cellanae TaxID=2806553 RepID=A0ABX7T705_9SPHN|nr:replication initiation protein RepC [Parasphingorhabdus cellanae]QTD57286.1 hypothetical protein J4G78_07055 [Parasphingorhabdus cellanae]
MSVSLKHRGLPNGIGKFDLLTVFEQVAKSEYRLSRTAVMLIRQYILGTMTDDYQQGRICAVWKQVSRIARSISVTPKSINNAERELEYAGFIVRTTGVNGARNGERCHGVVRWAAGINLAPLIERFEEMSAKLEARRLSHLAIDQCRSEIRYISRSIRDSGDAQLREQADAVLPSGRTCRISSLQRLETIKADLIAIMEAIDDRSGATKTSDASEQNRSPNIQDQKLEKTCRAGPDSKATKISLRTVFDIASPDYRSLIQTPGSMNTSNLVEASGMACHWLGISQNIWRSACHELGRERAALCVIIIDRNARLDEHHRFRAREPGRCLSGMIRMSKNGGFNPHSLFRACQGQKNEIPSAETEAMTYLPFKKTDGASVFSECVRSIVDNLSVSDLANNPQQLIPE